jgi:hypothetical protein
MERYPTEGTWFSISAILKEKEQEEQDRREFVVRRT